MGEFKPILATALTHVHVGVGRSPGTVDLPVVKDPFGVFYIPGSSIKGSMKTAAARNKCKEAIDDGKVMCNECREICCVFGGEDGGETSRIVISDLYPLLVPVPSMDKGMIFATSNLLIKKAESMLSVSSNNISIFEEGEEDEEVYIGTEKVKVKKRKLSEQLRNILQSLNPLYGLTEDVYVLKNEGDMSLIINRSLVRLTRIRLDRVSKTVQGKALWTEEYVPHGTLFVGVIGDRGWDNEHCEKANINNALDKLKELLANGNEEFVLIVGGKETVGKGLMKFKVV